MDALSVDASDWQSLRSNRWQLKMKFSSNFNTAEWLSRK